MFFSHHAVVLLKTCKHILMWKIGGVRRKGDVRLGAVWEAAKRSYESITPRLCPISGADENAMMPDLSKKRDLPFP